MAQLFALLIALVTAHLIQLQAARVQPELLVHANTGVAGLSSGCVPTQVHLALGKDATEMHVSWKTASANCPSELIYKKASGAQNQPLRAGASGVSNAVGYSFLLSERDMCSEPAASYEFVLYLHRAKLTQLEPNMQYLYQVAGSREVRRFRAGVSPDPDHEFSFLAFGDMGDAVHAAAKSPGAAATLLRLKQEVDAPHRPTDLILHVGDISYANGDPDIWDSFMDAIEPIASRVPYMVAVGNHEYGYSKGSGSMIDPSGAPGPYQPSWGNFGSDSRGECGVMTARRFHMPQHSAADAVGRSVSAGSDSSPSSDSNAATVKANAPFWYSFDYGSVHFTVISTEHSVEPGSRQYDWLQDDLAAVDRCATPWLVVLLHRPLYVVYPHKSNRDVGEHLRDSIEHLMLKYRVDATISGHVHSYYRTCPVYDEQCIYASTDEPSFDTQSNGGGSTGRSNDYSSSNSSSNTYGCDPTGKCEHGIVHFVIGSAGHKLSAVERGQEAWVTATVQRWGYGRFTVHGRDKLLVEYVDSEDGEVLDWVQVRPTAAHQAMCSHLNRA